ncbi:MAG: ATP synthase F1 subunit epsilon [Cytophagales bacterium]|nr:MAG: ATP synthase F1 subunit epsilon [Cytophagales bacterium]
MFLEIITPDAKVFEGEVDAVKVPGSKGEFEVLNNHVAIVSALQKGIVRATDKQGKHTFKIDSGVIEVLKNKVVILVESASAQ